MKIPTELMLKDATLSAIVNLLTKKYKCHTIALYGSRARGKATATSDYDVFGVRKTGPSSRIAKLENDSYWDVFVYNEKDLKELNDERVISFKDARLLVDSKNYGKKVLKQIQSRVLAPYKPLPKDQINALKVWAQKQLDRCNLGDTHGLYRRAEFQFALVEHYFNVRNKKFWGPKAAILWLDENDRDAYLKLTRSLEYPTNLQFLGELAETFYKTKLNY